MAFRLMPAQDSQPCRQVALVVHPTLLGKRVITFMAALGIGFVVRFSAVAQTPPGGFPAAPVQMAEPAQVDEVDRLISTLADGNFEERVHAAMSLGVMKDSRAVAPLIQALTSEYVEIRTFAAHQGSFVAHRA
jgi:HEAT repeat protein